MQPSEKKTLSCSNCRKRKRKCDGGQPCSSCSKKSIACDYNTTDRRSQRYSVGYIKSLETNNDVLENTLAELVALRGRPEELVAKLETLSVSCPKRAERAERPEPCSGDNFIDGDFEPSESDDAERPFVTAKDQYFGAGSVFHSRAPTQEQEPLLVTAPGSRERLAGVVTLEKDYEYVAGLVRSYFNTQSLGTQHMLFDRNRVLHELERRNFEGPFLNTQLVYAICANCELLSCAEADAYCDYVLKDLFLQTVTLSIAVSQAYTLLALHCASRGQISKAWLFAGIGIRVGLDVGFDMCRGEASCPIANRCFMGTLVIDQYLCMSLGRRPSLLQNVVPVLRLHGESDADYFSAKYSVELIEMTKHMVLLTYQPVVFDKDAKVNYLLKFNRLKVFNMKLLQWRQRLDPTCSWLYASLKASKDLASQNHTLKFLYYYMLIFLNKPFLHVPKQHSTVFLIEEMAKEVYLIVHLKLLKINEETGIRLQAHDGRATEPLASSNKFCCASMDTCVMMLLAKVLMTLMTSQPAHYIHLEKQFKAFAHYINYMNLRKYDATEKPMLVLLRTFEAFKASLKADAALADDKSSDHEHSHAEDEPHSSRSSPPTSDCSNSTGPVMDSELANSVGQTHTNTASGTALGSTGRQPAGPAMYMGLAKQEPEQFAYDPWWQEMNFEHLRTLETHMMGGQHHVLQNMAAYQQAGTRFQNPPFVPERAMAAQMDMFYTRPQTKQETLDDFPQRYALPMQTGIHSYDHLPRAKDPMDQVFNLLFSNTGDEFTMARERLDWESLFEGQ